MCRDSILAPSARTTCSSGHSRPLRPSGQGGSRGHLGQCPLYISFYLRSDFRCQKSVPHLLSVPPAQAVGCPGVAHAGLSFQPSRVDWIPTQDSGPGQPQDCRMGCVRVPGTPQIRSWGRRVRPPSLTGSLPLPAGGVGRDVFWGSSTGSPYAKWSEGGARVRAAALCRWGPQTQGSQGFAGTLGQADSETLFGPLGRAWGSGWRTGQGAGTGQRASVCKSRAFVQFHFSPHCMTFIHFLPVLVFP